MNRFTKKFITEDNAVLHGKQGQNESLESVDALDWIIIRESTHGSKFHAFRTVDAFYSWYATKSANDVKLSLHSWMLGHRARKVCVDLDMEKSKMNASEVEYDELLEAVEYAIIYVLSMHYDYEDEVDILKSHCHRDKKYSTHIRLRLTLANKREHRHFLELLCEELPANMRQFVDLGATSGLRLPMTWKDGHQMVWEAIDGEYPSFSDGLTNYTEGCAKLPKIAPKETRVINNLKHYSEADIELVRSVCEEHKMLQGFVFSAINSKGFMVYRRLTKAELMCDICKRTHSNDNMMVSMSKSNWFINCRRAMIEKKGQGICLGKILSKESKTQFNVDGFLDDVMRAEAHEASVEQKERIVDIKEDAEDAEDAKREYLFRDWTKFHSGEIDAKHAMKYFEQTCVHVIQGGNNRVFTKNLDEHGQIEWIEAHPKLFVQENDFPVTSVHSNKTVNFRSLFVQSYQANTFDRIAVTPFLKFDPTPPEAFNLFGGFRYDFNYDYSLEQRDEIPEILRIVNYHIRDVICSGDAVLYEYVMCWVAQLFQNPAKKLGIALLLKSRRQGTGKNTFTGFLRALLGKRYALAVDNIEKLTQKHNSHLSGNLLIVCDELANYAHHKVADKLKSMITNDTIVIEPKGCKPYTVNDYSRYIFTSNSDCALRVETGDRRFLPIDVSTCKAGDVEYFNALHASIENEEVQRAFFDYITHYDISKWNPREIPNTDLKQELMLENLASPVRYVIEVMKKERPAITYVDPQGEATVNMADLYYDYGIWMTNGGEAKIASKRMFCKAVKNIGISKKVVKLENVSQRCWVFSRRTDLNNIRLYLSSPTFKLD